MKNLLLLLFVAFAFQACEDTETNSPAFQANVDSAFFKAHGTYAVLNDDDHSLTIIGLTDNQELSVVTRWRGVRSYDIGPDTETSATFKDAEGNVVTTKTDISSGSLKITRRNMKTSELSGSFNFSSVNQAGDTIVVNKGLFYQVPLTVEVSGE